MAVETRYGVNFTKYGLDPREVVDTQVIHGRVRILIDTVEVQNGDSSGSTYTLAKLPSNALVLPQSTLHHDAISGLTDVDFGDVNDHNNLLNQHNMTQKGDTPAIGQVGIHRYGQLLWEILNYTEDPKRQIDLCLILRSDATDSGTVTLVMQYVVD